MESTVSVSTGLEAEIAVLSLSLQILVLVLVSAVTSLLALSSGFLVNQEEHASTSNSVSTGALVMSYTGVAALGLSGDRIHDG